MEVIQQVEEKVCSKTGSINIKKMKLLEMIVDSIVLRSFFISNLHFL